MRLWRTHRVVGIAAGMPRVCALLPHASRRHQIIGDHVTDQRWIVRRIKTATGHPVNRPKLWGVIYASSATVAVVKFVNTLNVHENPQHFEAILDGKLR